jgi:uridine kinase
MTEKMMPETMKPKYESAEAVADTIAASIRHRMTHRSAHARLKPYLVAVDGPMAGGKSTLANMLKSSLEREGVRAVTASGDDFLRPSAERKPQEVPGMPKPDLALAYYRSVNEDELSEFLEKISAPGGFIGSVPAFNLETDAKTDTRPYSIDSDTVVIVEGLFLHKENLRKHFNTSVYIDLEPEEALARALARNAGITDKPQLPEEELRRRFDQRYGPGFYDYYLKLHEPRGIADFVVDTEGHKLRISAQKRQ